jgi:hypothetical protein
MKSGPDLAGASLAREVLARSSWRPAAAQGTRGLLGRLAAHASPMLERARALQAWHDGLARRWRPVEIPPAHTVGAGGPASAARMTGMSAALDATAPPGASPDPYGVSLPSARGTAAPARAKPGSGAQSQARRQPAAPTHPARPALTITALAASTATPAPALPMPFRSSAPEASAPADPPTGGAAVVPAIGRRFARREVGGGFPEIPSRALAGGRDLPAEPAPIVPWRAVDGERSDDAPRRAGATLRASQRHENAEVAPALPVLRVEPPLPGQWTGPTPGRVASGADLLNRLGPTEASAPAALSLRLVPPEEAARRLAQGDDGKARDDAAGARTEAGAGRGSAPSAAKAAMDIDVIVERVQRELKRRERFERERKGLL